MGSVLTDGEIVSLFFSRDENAIQKTEQKYGKLFRSISRNILDSDEDVEECINDTYLKLWNAIPPEKPDSLKAYGSKTVRNTSINRAEYNSAQKRKLNALCEELGESVPSAGSIADENELNRLLNDFLRGLKKETRIIFILRYFHGEQTESIAQKMDVSDSKVRSVLFRTRQKLKDFLEKEGISI